MNKFTGFPDLTVQDLQHALKHAHITLAHATGREDQSSRELRWYPSAGKFQVLIGGWLAWTGDTGLEALKKYNTIDPVNVDYTRENMAAGGF